MSLVGKGRGGLVLTTEGLCCPRRGQEGRAGKEREGSLWDSAQSGWKLLVPAFRRAREEIVELCSVSPLCLCGPLTSAEAPQPLTFLCSNPVGLSLGMLDLFGEHPIDAMVLGQSSGFRQSVRVRSHHHGWLVPNTESTYLPCWRLKPRARCLLHNSVLPSHPGTQRDLREAGEARRGRTARAAWCGCECTLLLHPCLTSPLSQPSQGSGCHCSPAVGLIQAGNLVLTQVAGVPNGGPWPSSQTLPAPG